MSNNESEGQETSLYNNKADEDNIIASTSDITDDNIPKTESTETEKKCKDENLKELENVSAQIVPSSNVDSQAKVPDTKTLS